MTRPGSGKGRIPPPDRRPSETRRIRWCPPGSGWDERTVHVTLGYGADMERPVEIFYAGGYRSGSEIETLVSDMCIVLSHMLQHSDMPDPSEILRTAAREVDPLSGEVRPASIVGVLLEELRKPPHWRDGEGEAPAPAQDGQEQIQ